MVLLREDLWQALFQAVKTLQLGALAGAGQVALSLWLHLGSQLMLQLEAFLQVILLRLAQGSRNAPTHHQEAAMEVNNLLDVMIDRCCHLSHILPLVQAQTLFHDCAKMVYICSSNPPDLHLSTRGGASTLLRSK